MPASNVMPISENLGARVGRKYPRSMPGMLGMSENRGQAADYFSNAAARTGWGTRSLTEATEYELVRLTYNYWLMITLYQNHWICRKIVDVPAQDMVRAWPKLTSEIDPKDLTRINNAIRNTRTKSNLLQTLKWGRLFGGAGALIVIDGHENILDEPLDVDSLELGSYRGLIPFDRWAGIYPSKGVSTDLKRPLEFNLPEFYDIQVPTGNGHFQVHASRILRFIGPSVPTPEYQAMNYWGISVLEPAFEEIRKRDNMSWNIISLTYRANLIGMKFPELAQALSGVGMSQMALTQFQTRMQSVNELMSNQSLIMLPKDGEMSNVNYSFTGMAEMYSQFQLDIAGAAEIPVTRLYGRTLTGLGQSNDADERIYEEKIALDQSDQMEPQLDKLFPVICMSELGEVPEDLGMKFPSVRVLDEKEKSDLAKNTADSVVSVFGAGIINRVQALKELKQGSDVTGIYTNLTDEDIEEAEAAEKVTPTLQLEHGKQDEEEEESNRRRSKGQHDSADNFPIEFAGIPCMIEYQAGARRTIHNEDGDVVYDRKLKFDYGFIRGTQGRDGDETDVILGPNEDARNVYIVNMLDYGPDVAKLSSTRTQAHAPYSAVEDEYKILLGFENEGAAKLAFLSMYPETFFGGIETVTLKDFSSGDSRYGAFDSWNESEHPRGQPGNPGQFGPGGGSHATQPGKNKSEHQSAGRSGSNRVPAASKGGGGRLAPVGTEHFKRAPQVVPEPYDISKFRAPNKHDKVPGGWINVRVNPDPNADVEMVGVMEKSQNPIMKPSKAFLDKQKAERAKWPAWAQKLKFRGQATNVRLNPEGPKADFVATYENSVGETIKVQSDRYRARRTDEKFRRVARLDKKFPVVYSRIQKDLKSADEDVRQAAQVADLCAMFGVRPGGGENSHSVITAKAREKFPEWAKKMQVGPEGPTGAITLESDHVVFDEDGQLCLRFLGKESWPNDYKITDPAVAKWLLEAKKIADRPSTGKGNSTTDPKNWQSQGGWMFPWVTKASLDKYTKKIGAEQTYDFRRRVGTNAAKEVIATMPVPKNEKELKKATFAVGDQVAKKLCNSRDAALSAYIDPDVFEEWRDGLSD